MAKNELERMREEILAASFEVLSRTRKEGLREN
jgi:hypothetical protein